MGENAPSVMAAPDPQRFEDRKLIRFTWDQRIQRARELAQTCASAAEILNFYAELASFQKSLYEQLGTDMPTRSGAISLPGHSPAPAQLLLSHYRDFLSFICASASESLAAAAKEMLRSDAQRLSELLAQAWQRDWSWRSTEEGLLALAYVQPYAEFIGDQAGTSAGSNPPRDHSSRATSPVCPTCGSEPVCGVLRPEGYGARRNFICFLCAREWDFPRLVCPACNEQRAQALPVFTADEFKHIRVEACDTCKHYIKTVDLTRNGRAVPVVDEIASVSLGLWAREKGYSKLQPNLFAL